MAVTKKELKAQMQALYDELNALDLPAIEGTEKQLPYAQAAREKSIALTKKQAEASLKSGPSEWSIEYLQKDIDLLRTRKTARYWMSI